jgi:myo-inositol 2-dehydrogenase/D-chiro-inositol 1-dehydrogenase
MTRALRVGIAGCGFVTATRHLPAIGRLDGIEVVALADLDPTVLARVAGQFGIARRYGDPAELVHDEDVDAVAVCVPAAHHVEVALQAIEAGKHVLVEKPLTLSLVEADRLVERARSSPLKVQVGFNLRWHRLVRQARGVLESGRLGRIHAVRSVYSDSTLSRPGLPQWRRERLLGGGGVLEKGVHHFDLLRFLLGDEVEELTAWSVTDRGDDQTVSINGRTTTGTLISALLIDSTTISNELTFYGEAATLRLDCFRTDGLELHDLDDQPGAPATRLRRIAASIEQLGGNVGELRRGGAFHVTYAAEWAHFARAVRDGLDPGCTLDDGRRALQIALAVLHSAAIGGGPVEVAQAPASLAEVGTVRAAAG